MKNKGFTLVELLAVIAIIGILSAITYSSLSSVRAKGRDTRRLNDLSQIQLGLAVFLSKNSHYPSSLSELGPVSSGGNDYFKAGVPTDPLSSVGDYEYSPTESSGVVTGFCLGANMETEQYIMATRPCDVGSADHTIKK